MSLEGLAEYQDRGPNAVNLLPGKYFFTRRANVQIAGFSPFPGERTMHIRLPGVNYKALMIALESAGYGFKVTGNGLTKFKLNESWYIFSGQNQTRHFHPDNVLHSVAVERQQSGIYAVYHLYRQTSGDQHVGLWVKRNAKNWRL